MKQRMIISITCCLLLAACSVLGENTSQAPGSPTDPLASNPTPALIPDKLAASIPVVEWKGTSKGHLLIPIDPANGQRVSGYEPISLGQSFSHAFSPNQHTLALVGFGSGEHPHGGSLHLIDLKNWDDQVYELQLDAHVNAMSFSPDGRQLGIAYGSRESQILIFDFDQAAVTKQRSMDFLVFNMKFTAEGNGLMVYGSKLENRFTASEMSPDPPIVALLDSAELNVGWISELKGIRHGVVPQNNKSDISADLHQPGEAIYLFPGLIFAPDQNTLYIVHADEDKLTTVDFESGTVKSTAIRARISWFERLLSLTTGVAKAKVAEGTNKNVVISPDGRFLYIVGQRNDLIEIKEDEWQVKTTPLGMQIIDPVEGSRLAYYDTRASELSISSDGKYLYLRGWGESQDSAWTQIFDTSLNKFTATLEDVWLIPTRQMDGTPILASSVWMRDNKEHHNAIADWQSVLTEWSSSNYLAWLTTP